jgi:hypothetical protein
MWAHSTALIFKVPQSNGLCFLGVFEILSLLCTSVHDAEELQCVITCETNEGQEFMNMYANL